MPELQLYQALMRNKLSRRAAQRTLASFKDVFQRSRSGSEMASVADTMHFALEPYLARTTAKGKAIAREMLANIDALVKKPPSAAGT